MTSWGVEGGEVPRWLLALQSWEVPPPPPPPCSLLTFGIFAFVGKQRYEVEI